MRWEDRERSQNVDDRRRKRSVSTGIGIGAGTLILAFVIGLLGGNPMDVLQNSQQQQPRYETDPNAPVNAAEEELAQFVSVVLKETEDVWNRLFPEQIGKRYQEPTLVLFSGSVSSACGNASSATGPFYCPGDYKLYIDLSFYEQLKRRFNAPGDFAMAYVVAHEVGHHVQNLLGFTDYVHNLRRRLPKTEYNQYSVRLELMADYLAGVWARETQKKGLLNDGDIEEAMRAAHAIGDDTIQKRSQGYVVPDSFTHGTSEQRMKYFKAGLETGNVDPELLKKFFEAESI